MARRLIPAVLVLSVAACSSIGPRTVPHDRIDHGSAIGSSWKEQTLFNIVKLRYTDMPIFLEVAQGHRRLPAPEHGRQHFYSGELQCGRRRPFHGGRHRERGKHLHRSPYGGLSAVHRGGFVEEAYDADSAKLGAVCPAGGYSPERVMPIMLDSINGLVNGSNRLKRAADPRFTRLVALAREGSLPTPSRSASNVQRKVPKAL